MQAGQYRGWRFKTAPFWLAATKPACSCEELPLPSLRRASPASLLANACNR